MAYTTDLNNQLMLSNTLMNLGFRSKPGRRKKTRDGDKCLVCGDLSIGLNFGVQTCSPCKAFFRRNAVKLGTHEFLCLGDGDCPVTSDTRRQCNCCRLAKCFRVGMNPKAIRTEDQRLERIRLIEHNRKQRAGKSDKDEKTLEGINKQIMIRPSGLLRYSSQANSACLLHSDQILLTNIFNAYERNCISFTYEEHLNMPVDETLTLHKFMNASANMYMSLIDYLKYIPEFNTLPINAKMRLIKSNLNQILRVHSTFIFKMITPELDIDSPVFLHIFPEDLYMDMRATSMALLPFVNDPILIKLCIIVLMCSTHMNIHYDKNLIDNDVDNYSTIEIFNVQNIYIELLWRYILSRCSNYRQAVQLLNTFINRILYSQIVQVKINKFIHTVLPSQNHHLEPIVESIWIDEK